MTSLATGDVTISHRSQECLRLLERCLDRQSQFSEQSNISERSHKLAEESLARFNIWASNNGVFAGQRASLDFRLRDAPDISGIIAGLLEALREYVRRALHAIDGVPFSNSDTADERPLSSSSSSCSSDSSFSHTPEFERKIESPRQKALQTGGEIIDRLHRLSLAIRKSGMHTQHAKAADFVMTDEDGEDMRSRFEEYLLQVIKHRHRPLDEKLRERLAHSLFLRRKLFLYRETHRRKLAKTAPEAITQIPVTSIPGAGGLLHPDETISQKAPMLQNILGPRTVQSTQLSYTTATAFDDDKFRSNPAPSIASSATTAPASTERDIEFPLPPRTTLASRDTIECPYCCLLLRAPDFTRKRPWRRHVKADLEPYTCLLEICPTPYKRFATVEDWLAHMYRHSKLEWVCAAHNQKQKRGSLDDLAPTAHGRDGDGASCKPDAPARHVAFRTEGGFDDPTDNTFRASKRKYRRHKYQFTEHKDDGFNAEAKVKVPDNLEVFHSEEAFKDHIRKSHAGAVARSQLTMIAQLSAQPVTQIFTICPFCSCLPEGHEADSEHGHPGPTPLQRHVAAHLLSLALLSLPWLDDVDEPAPSDVTASKTGEQSGNESEDELSSLYFGGTPSQRSYGDRESIKSDEMFGLEVMAEEQDPPWIHNTFENDQNMQTPVTSVYASGTSQTGVEPTLIAPAMQALVGAVEAVADLGHVSPPTRTSAQLSLTSSVIQCLYCEQTFTGVQNIGNRERHVRLKHRGPEESDQDLTCQWCGKNYRRKDAMKKHEWKKHRKGRPPVKRRRTG